MNDKTPRCQTCGLTDEQYSNSALACRDPWHADDHLRPALDADGFTKSTRVRPQLRQTYTYALLEVSATAYDEIAAKLIAADYQHAFVEKGVIDMHGIALTRAEVEERHKNDK